MRMELGLSQHQTIKQIQTLSPQMYMSMEILCLNSLELEERLETEIENNETLELAELAAPRTAEGTEAGPGSDGGAGAGAGTDTGAGAEAGADAEQRRTASETEVPLDGERSFEQRFEQWDNYSREEYATSRTPASYAGERDEKLEALANTEGRPMSLQEHLEEQVHLLDAQEIKTIAGASTDEEAEAIRHLSTEIIYNIDNRGYLMYGLEEISASLDPKPRPEVLEQALKIIQSLDPPGIGGRDLRECLLLQLRRDRQGYPIEEKIIQEHLGDLGHNRLPKIAKALGASLEEVKTAAENIASLNPLPGKLFGGEPPAFIRPDVTVEDVEGTYDVRIESGYLPRLQINPQYRQLYKESRSDPELKKYLKKKMDSAEWIIAAIRQRQSTLEKIAREVVGVQAGFLDHGISHLRPLKMVDIAERVGVHVSTISRAISGKYMQTPRGIFPLKYFFTGGATKSDGTTESRESVIQRIKELIAAEDKGSPLSDIDIVKKLADASLKISRRTVTKYREAEGIASSRERRAY